MSEEVFFSLSFLSKKKVSFHCVCICRFHSVYHKKQLNEKKTNNSFDIRTVPIVNFDHKTYVDTTISC